MGVCFEAIDWSLFKMDSDHIFCNVLQKVLAFA